LKLNVPRIGVENEGLREVNESKTSAIHMCFVRLQVYLFKSNFKNEIALGIVWA
jgi:hypothetical protein